ncbi:hypothetical protein SUGI_0982890 [Cryptomeria japonica]|uniref:PHD finger protein PERSISTENT TAPETAL CELL 1 n=1 Tax=Cryptomeria japonica TaxID=3369 RepID=UPI00241488D3|nr:PHD finger protein PERSISTENT TAPETAL CELL 1 [Cryptomeria japonica]GLJ46644.1 hypothetical protein SUGI_0982890 [Cryptomeria japonica]
MSGSSDYTGKRKRREKIGGNRVLYGFQTFGDPGCPSDFDGPFRDNIRLFLQNFFHTENYLVDGMTVRSISLQVDDTCYISMFLLQEMVDTALRPHCNYCRRVGWSRHLVSKCRYHFIIPAQRRSNEDGTQPTSVLDMQSHLLHGMIHSNGFGHLLCINGREKGSMNASGREILDLWDRICAMLRARKVSVEDIAKKKGMELRVLHCLAYGDTWFGRWGFQVGSGISHESFSKSMEETKGIPLATLLQGSLRMASVVGTYQKLSANSLNTLGNLMSFMMELKSSLPYNTSARTSPRPTITHMTTPCRWSPKRVELATSVVIEALRICGANGWVPRQQVRDVARGRIGDTGLLDFVLKSLGNRVVGRHVVLRAINPVTKILEYSLQEVQSAAADVDCLTRDAVWSDVASVYKCVMEKKSIVRMIVETKQLVKDYLGEVTRRGSSNRWGFDDDEMLRIMCRVRLMDDPPSAESAPPDLLVMPPYSTIGDLKKEAERALRETYYVTRHFHVECLADLEGKDDDLLFGLVESGSCVAVKGSGIDMSSELRYQGGVDTCVVNCLRGSHDDDGHRVIACDSCGSWQQARCAGIADVDSVSRSVLCKRCAVGLVGALV